MPIIHIELAARKEELYESESALVLSDNLSYQTKISILSSSLFDQCGLIDSYAI